MAADLLAAASGVTARDTEGDPATTLDTLEACEILYESAPVPVLQTMSGYAAA
jgi:hypothetical protein